MSYASTHPTAARAPRCDSIRSDAHRTLLLGSAVGLCALIAWANLTQVDAVTRSSGTVVPFNQNQIVQHLEGGIVSEILVREGDKVEQGQLLLRIRDSQSLATLQQTQTQLAAKRATLARLEAEIAGAPAISFPVDLAESFILVNERDLFQQRRREQTEQIMLLDDKIRQHEIALAGLNARRTNLQRERELTAQRTQSLQRLSDLGAVSRNELLQGLTALQQLDTKITDISHDIPQTEAALSEAVRQRNAASLKFRSDASEEKTKVLVEVSQLSEAMSNLREKANRTDIRAPTTGTINKQYVATVGGVIAPGAPILEIVPSSDTIAIEAQLSPQDRAEIWPGSKAVVKITAYDYSLYGGLDASVVDISPDIIKEKDNQPYFRVRLNAANRLGNNHPIIPGMMANVDILTKRHTVLQYLLLPLMNVKEMAFRR
ncbi:HlyD family type I secretion periplasmic adaptor subunit [Bosea sp. (in: a-proteobacteria)]|uniref:HlyD family type I secretion periplasmic adaptor subunit n=1 Tax=Bosea sp. (in: a-proteobacteria) TaxID=1871050 RepID=UPI003B3BE2CD